MIASTRYWVHHIGDMARELTEARAASQRLGVPVVQRGTIGHWRAICRSARDRAARLGKIKTEMPLTPRDHRALRLDAIRLDLHVEALRARRQARPTP